MRRSGHAILCLLLALGAAQPAWPRMGGLGAQEVANRSGVLTKSGGLPRRVQGPTITRVETPAGRAGYTLWGYPTAEGPIFNLVALLFGSGRDVAGASVDGSAVPEAYAPGGRGPSDRGWAGNVRIPISAALYARGLAQGLQVEILGAPNLRFTVPRDYFRGYDARYRSVFGC